MSIRAFARTLLAVGLLAIAPAPTRAATENGQPACDYCRMIIVRPGFCGTVTLGDGHRYLFESIECMAAAVLTDSVRAHVPATLRVIDHDSPRDTLDVRKAVFLHSNALESPMGLGFSAYGSRERAAGDLAVHPGELLDWNGVLARVNSIWFSGKLDVKAHQLKFKRVK